jgi:hypothetical protein
MGRSVRTLLLGGLAALLTCGVACSADSAADRGPVVVLARAARDSMNAAFARSNEHWNELADLNTMERMLGTIRPTQREYLGCLQGQVNGGAVEIDGWVPARRMKQLQLAVAGSCDSVPRLVGTWHTHPFRADQRNLPVKERRLSTQDLQTFGGSRLWVTLVVWDHDSVDAALRTGAGATLHPARVVVK